MLPSPMRHFPAKKLAPAPSNVERIIVGTFRRKAPAASASRGASKLPGCSAAAASVACVMLQGLVTLSATIAIQNACCVSVLMRVLRSRRLRLSTKSLSRGVCKAGGSCWNQDVDAALRNAESKGTPKVGCVVCSCGCFGLRVLGCSAGVIGVRACLG